ncbi:MAG: metalloregulator ArsR/SmtB family transcription factor [Gemmatimonadota bacterium]|nr:metalloregulator ArsR/SmtB family transcription factor [Gemmatimonadota bacterium]MDH4351318.1 metalloregulator ArsR/SmtB family transcription factor [Gemmatimonadota bacterium]
MARPAAVPPAQPLTRDMLTRAAEMIKCLGHPLRLRLVEGLEAGELSVTALQEYTGAPQAQVSQQLAALKARGIVDCRRDGAFVYYRITEPRVHSILNCVRACDRP